MRTSIIAMLVMLTGCSMKQWYPTLGATAAGATGAALGGGPLVVGLAAGGGALAGEVTRGNEAVKDAEATIRAISQGDVEALVSQGLASQKSSFENAMDTIWLALKVAAFVVIGFLTIPLFITRSNSKKIKKICDKHDKAT